MDEQNEQRTGWVCLEQERIVQTCEPMEQPVKKTAKIPSKKLKKTKKIKKNRKHGGKRIVGILAGIAAFLIAAYCFLVYSRIPFIEKWRTIYIETAMGTMTHQWLATAFLPQSVIDEVMNGRATVILEQDEYNSEWMQEEIEENSKHSPIGRWKDIKDEFETLYSEIDMASFWKYMSAHTDQELLKNGYLMIDAADYDAEETGIQTIYGDSVCAIDTKNGIVIVGLKGDTYCGRMAIVKNPAQVRVASAKQYGSKGSYLADICSEHDAILGINASGFYDPEGTGNGGDSYGIIQSGGIMVSDVMDMNMKVISLNDKNQLNVTKALPEDSRDAVQFSPALIINGRQLISGSSGWGLQPRSVIGQTVNGEILMAIIDGRQPGYSIGITLGDLTDILYRYGAYQACNLDGGSSAVMYYNGRQITNSSSATPKKGRHIPDAWIVDKN